MHISPDEADLLADPRYQSGYRYVYQRKSSWRVSFQHGGRYVVATGFDRCLRAAEWVVGYYRERYGEAWPEWLSPKRRPAAGGVAGPGWVVRPIDDGEFLLEVCPCGVWCRVEHFQNGRRDDVFPSQAAAIRALRQLNHHVWPLFGPKILDAAPYRTPKRVVTLPAITG